MTAQEVATGMAILRDERAAGETTDDGVLVDPEASLRGWLGYDDANTVAINAVLEALAPLICPETTEQLIHGWSSTVLRRLGLWIFNGGVFGLLRTTTCQP